MINKDMMKSMAEKGIEDFSQSYIERIEQKDAYTLDEVKTAFKEGAKWMREFLDVTDMLKNML